MLSIFLRSLVYNVLFYILLVIWLIIGIPAFFLPRWGVIWVSSNWGRTSIWLMRVVVGTRVEIRGREKIPKCYWPGRWRCW